MNEQMRVKKIRDLMVRRDAAMVQAATMVGKSGGDVVNMSDKDREDYYYLCVKVSDIMQEIDNHLIALTD